MLHTPRNPLKYLWHLDADAEGLRISYGLPDERQALFRVGRDEYSQEIARHIIDLHNACRDCDPTALRALWEYTKLALAPDARRALLTLIQPHDSLTKGSTS